MTKVGRTLAFMDVTLRTKGGGKVVATGTHCKFLPNSQTSSKLCAIDRLARIDVVTLTLYELTLIERFVSIRDTPAPSEDAGTCTATCPATAART